MDRHEREIGYDEPDVIEYERVPRSRETLISAAFDDFENAEAATDSLIEHGFTTDRITVLLSQETRTQLLEVHPEFRDDKGHILAQTVGQDTACLGAA